MKDQSSIRNILVEQMSAGNAHVDFERSIRGLRQDEVGMCPGGFTHSIWELVEHIRIAQRDILEFSKNADYQSRNWPKEYWPESNRPSSEAEWNETITSIKNDRQAMETLVADPQNDLLAPIAHGDGQTLFREVLLIIDHNAYHVGQIVQLRKAMGNWQ